MFLVDTNVISEVRRADGDRRVKAWFEAMPEDDLHLSVVMIGELRQGIERLRRRDPAQAAAIERWLGGLKQSFSGRILKVTTAIAETWGRLNAADPLPPLDAFLAATALVHNLTLVTRDVRGLERTGVPLLNPWTGG